MKEVKINDLDNKLLAICRDHKHSVNQLSTLLKISPASVSKKIDKLEGMGLIEVGDKKRGKKTLIKTIKKGATKNYMVEILKKLKNNGGSVSFEEFSTTPDLFLGCEDYIEKSNANYAVLYSDMIKRKIELTDNGKQFLKENEK